MNIEFYNPEKHDAKKLEAHLGWRCLTVEEWSAFVVRPEDLEYWSDSSESWVKSHRAGRQIVLNRITYRTKTPLYCGAPCDIDPLAAIAKLVGL